MSIKISKIWLLAAMLSCTSLLSAAAMEENWNDFLHYTAIGRYELAKSKAEALIESDPDPVKMLELSQENPRGYSILLRVYNSNEQLKDAASSIIDIIEEGRYIKRTDPEIIRREIKRLSSTIRGRIKAEKRLRNSGEFAVPYLLNAIADESRKDEMPYITAALGKMGRDAVRPLCAALQMKDVAVKSEAVRALGSIGYSEALPHLKLVWETAETEDIKKLAEKNIQKIKGSALKVSSSDLFFTLAEDYYYHKDSLKPNTEFDFANVWFWDNTQKRLTREKVERGYFFELMCMRSCEWSLKADPETGEAIALWLDGFFKAQQTGIEMPEYFGQGHADAMTYAVTAGPEYLHQALARAIKDKNDYITLNLVEALAASSGEASLLESFGTSQPLVDALEYDNNAVQLSAAIALGGANPTKDFVGSSLIIERLSTAIMQENADKFGEDKAAEYADRAFDVLDKLCSARNRIVKVSKAQKTLIRVIRSDSDKYRIEAAEVLAFLKTAEAQKAIANVALSEDFDKSVRMSVFDSLIHSAKLHGSKLTDEQIDKLYSMTASRAIDSELRESAASAYGSLNLPSEKVKTLILDQARS
ncbi:hypothetical protein L21SP3_00943 [Sedimentisphaera cyanobacteriorum]|uniref:HEAT repeat domain-containing protein n=1 Tax=Sedimentisphaera cyanobacteriorum TaxID=1940790 RepID=A0A1Q2HPI5_9BACT|nr:HEAT repeat domain-containing protein [Sedimentisphaera cyanobacteriorum]AQQ09143.1 hypothetical protein L21SP3_00943 [Sedimentisphaera cyanobacteriorum]